MSAHTLARFFILIILRQVIELLHKKKVEVELVFDFSHFSLWTNIFYVTFYYDHTLIMRKIYKFNLIRFDFYTVSFLFILNCLYFPAPN
jgi:hypothetical protein